MFKDVAPRGAYIIDIIIFSYIHIGSAPSMEVIQDDLKEICSHGSYGLNPGGMQLDRPIYF